MAAAATSSHANGNIDVGILWPDAKQTAIATVRPRIMRAFHLAAAVTNRCRSPRSTDGPSSTGAAEALSAASKRCTCRSSMGGDFTADRGNEATSGC
jgi:hypothetical protein